MKKFSLSKTVLTILLAITALAAIAVPAISIYKYNSNADQFVDDGYMLLATNEKDSESINTQYYFNVGEKYRKTYDNNVTFSDVNGTKVKAEAENFIHYNSGSMNGLAESVILDTDNVDAEGQTSYYSIPEHTMLEKSGKRYVVNNAGNNINFSNFLWKISVDRYMVVSPTIKLVVSDKTEQTFEEFVELRYIDEGIAHIVTHEGTYSTVSSDAYLELENGIRIYIGSKNISNEDEILMNMSQMVVGSDDNVEVIPDDDYTIEQDKQPKIIVNATDGETGANGEEGDAGENGENGEPGAKGNKGGGGISGNDAPNANIFFEPEVKPLFTNLDVKTNTYGFEATVSYNENTCIVDDAWVSVIDKNSGNEVWRQNIKNSPGLNSSIAFNSETLSSDTEYVMNITGVYRTADSTVYLQEVLNQQTFKTESLGLTLSKKYATDRSLNFDIKKVSESDVDKIRIRVFDKNMEFLGETGYAIPVDLAAHNIDANKAFSVLDLGLDETIENSIEGLESNSIYYAQIQIMSVADGAAVPTSTYEKQKFKTLKIEPTIGKPTGRVEETISSFIINAGDVVDLDNGITGYRYEIFEANNVEAGPVYSVDLNQLQTISIPIGQDTDENVLHRETNYYAQIVALFDNNEEIKEVRSEFSESLYAGTNTAPEFSIQINTTDGYITPTTFEGRAVINDKFSSIDPNAKVTIKMVTSLDPAIAEGGDTKREVTLLNNVAFADFVRNGDGFDYSYPISAKSLKADGQEYTLYCYVSQIKKIDQTTKVETIVGSEDEPVLIGTDSFSTTSYSPVYVDASTLTGTEYMSNWFTVALKFAPSNQAHEDGLRGLNTIVAGLADKNNGLADMTGRSISLIYLELYNGKLDAESGKYVPGTTAIANALLTDTIKSDQQNVREYGRTYTFNTDFFANAYCKKDFTDEKTILDNDFGLIITDKLFTDPNSGYNPIHEAEEDDVFFIKVSAYDYTYGTTYAKENHVNGDSNIIPIGTATGYTSSEDVTDQWIPITVHFAIPEIPQDYPYVSDEAKITLGKEKTLYKEPVNANYYEYTETPIEGGGVEYSAKHNSNIVGNPDFASGKTKESLTKLWDDLGISDTTAVGIEYRGPAGLAAYCSKTSDSVRYKVYKGNIENFYDKDPSNDPVLVTVSGWLNYDYTKEAPNNVILDYTFFFDVKDPTTGKTLHRGDEFFIETELKIKGKETDAGVDCVYPQYFYEHDILPNAPTYVSEDVIGTMVEAGDKVSSELIHKFRIFDDCTTNKQWPVVLSMPYDGNPNDNFSEDVTLLYINDPDNAIDRETEGERIIYIPDLDEFGQIQMIDSAEGEDAPQIIKLKEFDITERNTKEVYPIKISVEPGDLIVANCFKAAPDNGNTDSINATRISLLDADGNCIETVAPATVYTEFASKGYFTVPAVSDVKSILFVYYTDSSNNYCYKGASTNYYSDDYKVTYCYDDSGNREDSVAVFPIKIDVNAGDIVSANCFKGSGTTVALLNESGTLISVVKAENIKSSDGVYVVPDVVGLKSLVFAYVNDVETNYCNIISPVNYWKSENRVNYYYDESLKLVDSASPIFRISGLMNKIDNLYAKYKLKETEKEFSTIKLNSEEGIVKERTLYIHDTISNDTNFYGVNIPIGEEFKFAFENNKTIQIEYLYTCTDDAAGDKGADLLGTDVTFTKYVYDNVNKPIILKSTNSFATATLQADIAAFLSTTDPVYDSKEYENIAIIDITGENEFNPKEYYIYEDSAWKKAGTTKLVPATGDGSTKTIFVKANNTDEVYSDNIHYHKAKISIDGISIADIIKGSEKIQISIRAYYDSGLYGLKYADINTINAIDTHDSDFYLFEIEDENGIANHTNPSSSLPYDYPESYYAENTLPGLDMSNPDVDTINTYLFKRDQISYQLDQSRIVLGETMTHDEPPVTIPDELLNIVKVTERGFNGGVFKHVGKSSTMKFVEMSYILPTYEEIKIKAGHSTALFNFKIYDSETVLTSGQPVVIRCIKDDPSVDKSVEANWTTVTVPYTPTAPGSAKMDGKDRIWSDILVEDLQSDNGESVKFHYEVYAYVNDGTTEGTYTKIYDKGEFTIARYDHYPNEDQIYYETYVDTTKARVTRNSKHIIYGLTMKDIIKKDINKNLVKVIISAYKAEDCVASASDPAGMIVKAGAHAVASTEIPESTLENVLGDKQSGDIYYEAQLPWEPKANTDHLMSPSQRYYFKVDYVYTGDTEGVFDVPSYKMADYNTELVKWKNSLSSAYYTISGTKKATYDASENKIKHEITFNISGRDTNRLLPSTSDNKVKYIADLYKVTTENGVTKQEYQRSTSVLESTIDASGRIATLPVTFDNLTGNTRYLIKLYYVADFENIDCEDITAHTSDYKEVALTSGYLSGVYCKTSSTVITESSDMMILNTVQLEPSKHNATVIGANLNLVGKLDYTIKDVTTGTERVFGLSGANLTARFTPDPTSNNVYYLDLPEVNDPSKNYIVIVAIYRSATDVDYQDFFEAEWPRN